jgi:hypothetical protein
VAAQGASGDDLEEIEFQNQIYLSDEKFDLWANWAGGFH